MTKSEHWRSAPRPWVFGQMSQAEGLAGGRFKDWIRSHCRFIPAALSWDYVHRCRAHSRRIRNGVCDIVQCYLGRVTRVSGRGDLPLASHVARAHEVPFSYSAIDPRGTLVKRFDIGGLWPMWPRFSPLQALADIWRFTVVLLLMVTRQDRYANRCDVAVVWARVKTALAFSWPGRWARR